MSKPQRFSGLACSTAQHPCDEAFTLSLDLAPGPQSRSSDATQRPLIIPTFQAWDDALDIHAKALLEKRRKVVIRGEKLREQREVDLMALDGIKGQLALAEARQVILILCS